MRKKVSTFVNGMFSFSKKTMKSMTTPKYTDIEQNLHSIILAMTANSTINQIHCDNDSESKKYYIVVGNRTLIIDGNSNKVFILIDCKPNQVDCDDNVFPFIVRENVITDFIDILTKRKHLHTEEIYQRVLDCERNFLINFEKRIKEETGNIL